MRFSNFKLRIYLLNVLFIGLSFFVSTSALAVYKYNLVNQTGAPVIVKLTKEYCVKDLPPKNWELPSGSATHVYGFNTTCPSSNSYLQAEIRGKNDGVLIATLVFRKEISSTFLGEPTGFNTYTGASYPSTSYKWKSSGCGGEGTCSISLSK